MSDSAGRAPTGVLLINLGGPDSPEAIEPFLYNLFSDKDIITLPFGFQWLLPVIATWISKRRSTVAKEYYRLIGGKSPIRELTEAQRGALESLLLKDGDYRVFVGMRYWHPDLSEAVDQIVKEGIGKVIVLPLFPQYSITSSGSGINELDRIIKRKGLKLDILPVYEWYSQPTYIQSLVENINEGKKLFPGEVPGKLHVLFSAHGVPEKVVLKGDPYQKQIEKTVQLLKPYLKEDVVHLAYQSKIGRLRWIGPSVEEKLKELAEQKVQKVLAIPISFVSDHSETLYEIDIMFKKIATTLGIPYFYRMPSLNTSPTFIRALKEIVVGKK
ncbi:MAG: ferrochelatase [Nitrospiria bacterium]